MPSNTVVLDGLSLTPEVLTDIARNYSKVEISPSAIKQVEVGRASVQRILKSKKTIYGINTGFGILAETKVSEDEIDRLQLNLIRSHAVGIGPHLSEDEARAIMAVRLNTLLRGNSGVRMEVVRLLKDFLNLRVFPFIPRYGSLGASGDLAPSAHLALVLVGEGNVVDNEGEKLASRTVLRRRKLKPLKLKAKEGLAIINGTQVMTGLGSLLVTDATGALECLNIAAALSLEALQASLSPFDARVQELRCFEGQTLVAAEIRRLVAGSTLIGSKHRVQDAYSLRCIPQVHGAFHDCLNYVSSKIKVELNSVTDNPLVFPETDEVLSAGNFHGQPISLALDLLCVALAEASVISERRIDKLLSGYNPSLPIFLSPNPGLNSGLMVSQYTAAALVAENKVLARPASLESATVSAGQEDHASMGVTAALKTRTVVDLLFKVIAIEMLCASQALDLLGEKKIGIGTGMAKREVRKISKHLEEDRSMNEDVEALSDALKRGNLQRAVLGACD